MIDQPTSPTQEKVARNVSTIVLIGTCAFGVLGIAMAIVALSVKDGSIEQAKNILQILFSAILPLFGTWIGTILAYYFSRENLVAANQTVQHLVNSITSDKKLESIKAKDVMIPLEKLIYVPYKGETDDKVLNLKTDFLDFVNSKSIQRIILLDSNKVAKYVLHKSTIEGFIAEQYFSSQNGGSSPASPPASPPDDPGNDAAETPQETAPQVLQTLTFADLKVKGNASVQAILKNGVKFIKEDANLSDAKILIKNYVECNDVFITRNAAANEPVLGWITDKTISENSIV